MTDDSATRTSLSRRTLLGAAAWSVPVIATAVAAPLAAASVAALDASGVVITFTDEFGSGSSEFRLSGQVALPAPSASPVTVSATITWAGTGANSGSTGLYLYASAVPSEAGSILGWTLVQGAADDAAHETYIFQTTVPTGVTQATTVSSYGGSTLNGFMFGVESFVGGTLEYDGIITIRFSAPGYGDGVVTVPYTRPPV
ncbi:hypothetical protein SRABI76_01351 [Microbacterium oxydans]|uniref:Uncharacterized protein n=1 Tax=Microbacterium oxydans TaxID=82380 RepID=A0A0F0LAA8_9MICO|nr:hypothetical protein [Microbacterium oxydans]KJL30073.1 hypothetical protein RS83_01215 [Microbacterium oxydans]CAH0173848.1 hypothetical protein SRABI76_01351 [Microbacterium oxydans]